MASSTTCGTCAPAALSKNVNSGLRFNAGKAARTASTGKSRDCPGGLSLFRTLWDFNRQALLLVLRKGRPAVL